MVDVNIIFPVGWLLMHRISARPARGRRGKSQAVIGGKKLTILNYLNLWVPVKMTRNEAPISTPDSTDRQVRQRGDKMSQILIHSTFIWIEVSLVFVIKLKVAISNKSSNALSEDAKQASSYDNGYQGLIVDTVKTSGVV